MTSPHVRDPELGGPGVLGNRAIPTVARVAALDCLLDDIRTTLTVEQADMLVDLVATLFERGEVDTALSTLTSWACDRTGAYRVAAVLHTT